MRGRPMNENKKILIIEDDEEIAGAMKIVLESVNYDTKVSVDPEDGFQKAKDNKPDLILLDVMFGDANKTQGFDYAVKIKMEESLKKIPILMVTAVNARYPKLHFSPKTDGEYLPVDDFIEKPVLPKDLLQKVKTLLDRGNSKWSNYPNPPDNIPAG